MKNMFVVLVVVVFKSALYGQETAITQSGKTVILNIDGTWKYIETSVQI